MCVYLRIVDSIVSKGVSIFTIFPSYIYNKINSNDIKIARKQKGDYDLENCIHKVREREGGK